MTWADIAMAHAQVTYFALPDPRGRRVFPHVPTKLQAFYIKNLVYKPLQLETGLWHSGSVSDSRSEGWQFDSSLSAG